MPSVFRHIGSGQDTDWRTDCRSEEREDQAAYDGVPQAAASRARRRHVIGEDMRGIRCLPPDRSAYARMTNNTAIPTAEAAQHSPMTKMLISRRRRYFAKILCHYEPADLSRRIRRSRANESTMKVMMKRIKPRAMRADV